MDEPIPIKVKRRLPNAPAPADPPHVSGGAAPHSQSVSASMNSTLETVELQVCLSQYIVRLALLVYGLVVEFIIIPFSFTGFIAHQHCALEPGRPDDVKSGQDCMDLRTTGWNHECGIHCCRLAFVWG